MVRVVANMYIKEDNVEKFLTVVKELVDKTNALDPGCIRYELYRDKSNPLHFAMLEEWESQEAIDNHLKSTHFLEIIPNVMALTSKDGAIDMFEKAF